MLPGTGERTVPAARVGRPTATVKLDLEPELGSPPVVPPRPHRARLTRRGRWVIGLVFACSVGSVVGLLVADQVEQRDRYDRARATLRLTHDYIVTVEADLTALRHDVAVLDAQVGSDANALNQDSSQLQGAQSALSAAQNHVTQQATLITSLQACLGGVEQALNALSVGNKGRAIDQLDSVSSSCTSAAAASG